MKKPPAGTTDLVITARISDRPDPSTLRAGRDAVRRVCDDCGVPTWCSPKTQFRCENAHVVCEPCAVAYGYAVVRIPGNGPSRVSS